MRVTCGYAKVAVPVATMLVLAGCIVVRHREPVGAAPTAATPEVPAAQAAQTQQPAATTAPPPATGQPPPDIGAIFRHKTTDGTATPPPAGTSASGVMTAPNVFGGPKGSPAALKGSVYWLNPDTKSLPDLSKLTPATTLYAENLNVSPRDFREGFPGVDANRVEWFAIEYTGQFAVAVAGEYKFRVLSDDGTRVYVDNAPLLSNDGVHPAQSKSETIKLAAGLHSLLVDYFQATKWQVALQLFVTGPDGREKLWGPAL